MRCVREGDPGRPRLAGETAKAYLLYAKLFDKPAFQTHYESIMSAFKEWWATQPTEAEFTEVMTHMIFPSGALYHMVTHPFTAPPVLRGMQLG